VGCMSRCEEFQLLGYRVVKNFELLGYTSRREEFQPLGYNAAKILERFMVMCLRILQNPGDFLTS
jgi:hypothetical protein